MTPKIGKPPIWHGFTIILKVLFLKGKKRQFERVLHRLNLFFSTEFNEITNIGSLLRRLQHESNSRHEIEEIQYIQSMMTFNQTQCFEIVRMESTLDVLCSRIGQQYDKDLKGIVDNFIFHVSKLHV